MKRILCRICVLVIAAFMGARAMALQRQHVLDLTQSDLVVSLPQRSSGAESVISGQEARALPFTVQLGAFEDHVYLLGRPIKYNVRIKNVSQMNIGFPWSQDREAIERTGASFSQAILALQATDSTGRQYLLASVILDGSQQVPDSLETLGPGDEALIKAEIPINLPTEAAYQITSAGQVEVRAILSIKTDPRSRWKPLLSANSAALFFRPPGR